MTKIRTHYDNLMVARNAPPEVIAAAYRSLCFKFHPDRNSTDPQAARIMSIINRSYDVLSDPIQRNAHDQWIASQEASDSPKSRQDSGKRASDAGREAPRTKAASDPAFGVARAAAAIGRHVLRNILLYGMIAFIAVASVIPSPPPEPSGLAPYQASPEVEGLVPSAGQASPTAETNDDTDSVTAAGASHNEYVRPVTAPNGSPWPTEAGYVDNYPKLRTNGLSEVTIDNSDNASDVFVKLVAIDETRTLPVRHVFIPAYKQFTLPNVRAGQYDVRYMDLTDGALSRSESFNLSEIEKPGGIRYSSYTMTLYKVSDGNLQTYPLSPSEF